MQLHLLPLHPPSPVSLSNCRVAPAASRTWRLNGVCRERSGGGTRKQRAVCRVSLSLFCYFLLWLIRPRGGECFYGCCGSFCHRCCFCCGYIVGQCNFVRFRDVLLFSSFLFSSHLKSLPPQQPGFNNIHFTDCSFCFMLPPHLWCQQLPCDAPGLTWQ